MPRMRTTWIRYFLNWLSQAPFTLLINTTTLHVIPTRRYLRSVGLLRQVGRTKIIHLNVITS